MVVYLLWEQEVWVRFPALRPIFNRKSALRAFFVAIDFLVFIWYLIIILNNLYIKISLCRASCHQG